MPHFSHGRSMSLGLRALASLKWFIKDLGSRFAEYHHYRELIVQTFCSDLTTTGCRGVRRILDLIHIRYLAKHAPDSCRFVIGQKTAGVPFADFGSGRKSTTRSTRLRESELRRRALPPSRS